MFKDYIWAAQVWFYSPLGIHMEDSMISFTAWLKEAIYVKAPKQKKVLTMFMYLLMSR